MNKILAQKIGALAEAINKDPNNANVSFAARSYLVDNVLANVSIRKFNFNVDEPKELGGTDIAPNPVELVLAALASCQEIAFSAFAAYLGIELDQVKVHVKGNLDLRGFLAIKDSVSPGFQNIEYETIISSSEPEEKIKNLIEIVEKHCPVLDTLIRPISVTGNVKIKKSVAAA